MERSQVPASPRPPMVADPAAAATRDRGPTSRLLTVLRVSTDYLTPALMLTAAGVWLWALARAAEQLL